MRKDPAEGRLHVRVEPRVAGAFLQESIRLLVERSFLRGEMIREINLPALGWRSIDDREPPAQDVRVGSATGIGCGGELLGLLRREDRGRPRRLAEEGEARVFRERISPEKSYVG